ncbi:hypothetical protein [Allorhodopirellula heiligendammensis]|uniref:hypothetical protein n=1 Tax=Allorhodopirellula heiligendammensis TaxID=2714739 RepID=UPI00265F9E68|nr:hypothetical protein [Allorhodopirellula heiligendammensis]
MRSAPTASTRIDVELPIDDHARDISLELDERLGLGQFIVPAVWTARRQGNVVGFADQLGHRTAVVLAMVLAAFAPRLFRIEFAFLEERSRLAFAFPLDFFKTSGEQLDLLDQHVDNRLLLFKQRLAFWAIGRDLGHIDDPQILVDSAQIHQDQFFRSANEYLQSSQ